VTAADVARTIVLLALFVLVGVVDDPAFY